MFANAIGMVKTKSRLNFGQYGKAVAADDLRGAIGGKLEDAHSIGTNGIVHDLGWVEIE